MSCSLRSSSTSAPSAPPRSRGAIALGRGALLVCLVALLSAVHGFGQHTEPALSEAEVEQLREAAYIPADRVAVFIKLLDTRARAITDLVGKPRRPGREEDLHDLLDQFTSITDELNDNLDDYAPRHRDLRRQLPKLVDATDRWSTALRSAPDHEAYNVARRLALESVRDVHEEAVRLVTEQRSYFAAHPRPPRPRKTARPAHPPPPPANLRTDRPRSWPWGNVANAVETLLFWLSFPKSLP